MLKQLYEREKMNHLPAHFLVGLAGGALFCATACAIPAPTAYYSLDGNTLDSSTHHYNGSVNGTTQYGAGQGQTDAFLFDGGTNIATTTTDNLGLVGASFTVDAYVNFANLNDQTILGTTTGGGDLGLHLLMRSDTAYF